MNGRRCAVFGTHRLGSSCVVGGGKGEYAVQRGCDLVATDLASVVLAPLHYSQTTGANAFDVVQRRGNHRDELGGVKKSHALSGFAKGVAS